MDEIWQHFLKVFQAIWRYPIFSLGDGPFSLATLTGLLLSAVLILVVGRFFRQWVISKLLRRTLMEPALQYSIAKITHYAFVAIAFIIALQMVGVNLNSVTVVLGAMSIGIGFGLQNIVNNFVSGIIILIEQPVNVGDRIEVAGVAGRVTRIGARSTTVLTNDNISIIVPNADLVSHAVTNWSHGDPSVRFRIPLSVAYGTDLEKLRKLLLEVAAENPHALKEPSPAVYCIGFGDDGIHVELGVWTSELSLNPRRFRSQLNFAIEKKLRENQIVMPFPQRDLHLRSGEVRVRPGSVEIAVAPVTR